MNSTPVVTEVRPVRPPSAAPEVDSTKVVMEETPMETAHSSGGGVDDQDLLLIFSTLPSSVRNSPCLATAIAVPMVSKKSLMSSENRDDEERGVGKDLDDGGHAAGVGDGATDAREVERGDDTGRSLGHT